MLGMADKHSAHESQWSWATPALEKYASGVDATQIHKRLGLTPTERLERMLRFQVSLEQATHGRWPPTSKG
jgi:hypothetical protein